MRGNDLERENLIGALLVLSEACQRNISKELLSAYIENIKPHYVEASKFLRLKLREVRGPNSFPSIAEILEGIGLKKVEAKDEAREASTRIVDAVSRFGHTNHDLAKKYIGELGWLVVQRQGGWVSLCDLLTYDNMPTLQAQWRELAVVLQGKALAGTLDQPPGLPEPSPALKRALAIAQGET